MSNMEMRKERFLYSVRAVVGNGYSALGLIGRSSEGLNDH